MRLLNDTVMVERGLVVAKYKEDVSWLSKVPSEIKVYIYDKSGVESLTQSHGSKEPLDTGHPSVDDHSKATGHIPLANEGRDPGTFLYHIVEHYDDLDDWTYFVQGFPFDHYGIKKFFKHLYKPELGDYEELGNVVFNVVGNGSLAAGNLELTEVFREISGKEQLSFEFVWGMQVVLSRRLILRRSLKFYEDLLARTIELYKDERTLPLMERIWRAIWLDMALELE